MRERIRSAVAWLALVASVSCGSTDLDELDAALLVEPIPPGRPDSLLVRLENHSATSAAYNLCAETLLERDTGGGWLTIQGMGPGPDSEETGRFCILTLETLAPGEVAMDVMRPALEWPEGHYRVRTTVFTSDGRDHPVPSQVFEIVLDTP
ncbi:MAG: hypothetical protein R3344_03015 [Acidobacteriota bacterium]|nr:hypothetical protein [Acidobacteriota bacterium]